LTMHVPDPLAFAKEIGRGTEPCHVNNDCLAAAGKTRFRAPFGGFSRATPVLLLPNGPCHQRFVRPRRHPMPAPSSIAGMTFAGTITPGLRSGLQCLTGTPQPFSAGRRTIFCNGPRHGALRRLSTPATPVPPRRIAMRCSRGGTG
jgi:hypothetical protein